MAEIKNRRINKADIKKVEEFINGEYNSRKDAKFRQDHEEIWKEIDRQIAMKPMGRFSPDGNKLPKSWHNAFELGELSKTSEIITADVMRICFPKEEWFECHVEVPPSPEVAVARQAKGQNPEQVPEENQRKVDGVLRSMMVQQHLDFGFKSRFELSIKEALHHGSYAAVAKFNREMMVKDGDKVKFIGAPVWVPYSMWNAYPDPSPSVIPTGLFYTGSMILIDYLPLWKLKKQTGEGWMPNQYSRIKESETETKEGQNTKDVQMKHYYGDLFIDRKQEDGGIYLPNCHAITANDVLVYYSTNDLAHSPIIYDGYERQDIRDPYFTSPLIKQSPVQKITTICANKYLDAIALKVEPPIEYDGNDPDYALNGGPLIAPGAKTSTRSMGKGYQALDIGDPRWALEGLQMGLRQIQEGTGVSSIRSGVQNSDRQTATEVNKTAQGAEVRTIDFVAKLEGRGLRPFLYMQHELNRLYLEDYSFYNDEMNTPDFVRMSKKDIDFDAHFDIIGSRGLLGEEQRTQRIMQATLLFSQNPLFAPKLRPTDIMLDTYKDAGKKNPEEFVQVEQQQIPPEVQQKLQQAQQVIQQLGQKLQESEAGTKVEMAKLAQKAQTDQAKDKLERDKMQMQYQTDMKTLQQETQVAFAKIQADTQARMKELAAEIQMGHKELGHSLLQHITSLHHDSQMAAMDNSRVGGTRATDVKQKHDGLEKAVNSIVEVNQKLLATLSKEKPEKDDTKLLDAITRKKTVKITRTANGLEGTVQ